MSENKHPDLRLERALQQAHAMKVDVATHVNAIERRLTAAEAKLYQQPPARKLP